MDAAAAAFGRHGVGGGRILDRSRRGNRVHLRKMIEAVARQPEAEGRVGKYMWIGFALVEAIALYGLVIAFIIMGLRVSASTVEPDAGDRPGSEPSTHWVTDYASI